MIEQMTLIQPMKLWEPVEGLRSPEPAEKGRDRAEKSEGTLFSSILATAIQQVYDTSVSYRITCNNGNQRTLINP